MPLQAPNKNEEGNGERGDSIQNWMSPDPPGCVYLNHITNVTECSTNTSDNVRNAHPMMYRPLRLTAPPPEVYRPLPPPQPQVGDTTWTKKGPRDFRFVA